MDLSDARWFTSSFSGSNGNSCVEVAFLPDRGVAVRDTKDRALAPHIYGAAAWDHLLAGVRAGEFRRA